jgi:hypothetical protein
VPQHVGMSLELQAGAGARSEMLVFRLRPGSESRGDQLGDAVTSEDDGGEASCNDGEKKRGSYGVFHGANLSTKDAQPSAASLPTDWGRNLPLRVLRRRIDAGVVLTSALISARSAHVGEISEYRA